MEVSDERVKGYVKRLILSRMRLICNNGFYGLLLMHVVFALDDVCKTACTDGRRMFFNPEFLDSITDSELDYIIMHELLHIVLQHGKRSGDLESERYNKACDIVANSILLQAFGMDETKISLHGKACAHETPDGKEGNLFTAEQVYNMLPKTVEKKEKSELPGSFDQSGRRSRNKKDVDSDKNKQICNANSWDDHSKWEDSENDEVLEDEWLKRLEDVCAVMEVRDPDNSRGLVPEFAMRMYKELKNPQTDWRKILNEFIQQEITDYSFTPPDRRFDDSDFFLPDFNDKEDIVEDILFMIDTSGSMSDDMITAAYSEVKGAIDQFDGKLKGWLGFFDAAVIEPKPFTSESEFRIIKPQGGGGTSFKIIFDYVHKHMMDEPPAGIIILTDGYAPFPKESMAEGIPVLWLLNNDDVNSTWGKVARIKIDE